MKDRSRRPVGPQWREEGLTPVESKEDLHPQRISRQDLREERVRCGRENKSVEVSRKRFYYWGCSSRRRTCIRKHHPVSVRVGPGKPSEKGLPKTQSGLGLTLLSGDSSFQYKRREDIGVSRVFSRSVSKSGDETTFFSKLGLFLVNVTVSEWSPIPFTGEPVRYQGVRGVRLGEDGVDIKTSFGCTVSDVFGEVPRGDGQGRRTREDCWTG